MPEHKLDMFEVDESNKFAVALCKALVNLEKGYSPLLIHGEQGSGKTHLLSAVNTELTLAHPEVSILYISDGLPVEKLLLSDRHNGSDGNSEEFIYQAYSRKDFLIVDDIERFAADTDIREKFCALFDTFVDSGKQILIASSLPIENLSGFDKRFLSRLRGGIDASLSSPQPETRLKILRRECERLGLNLDVDILQMLMLEAGKDVAYLRKLPSHIKTFGTLTRQPLTKEKVGEFISIARAEANEDKGTITTEELYGSWLHSQARKQEGDFKARLEELEKRLSEQLQHTQQLKDELAAANSREQTAVAEASALSAEIQSLKREVDEKTGVLHSQEKMVSGEIHSLGRELKNRDKLVQKLKSESAKITAEKDSRISELEKKLGIASDNLAASADEQKRAQTKLERLTAELEKLKKDKKDELLALKIQLEDKEHNLHLLHEEREIRSVGHDRLKSQLEEQVGSLRNQNLLQEKTAEELNDRVRELGEQLSERAEELKKASDSNGTLIQERDTVLNELEKARATLAAEAERYAAELREHKEREQQALASLEEKKNEIAALRAETERQGAERQARVDSLTEELKRKGAETAHGAARLTSETEKGKSLEAKLVSAATSLEDFKKSAEAERAQLQQLVSEKERMLNEASQRESKARHELDTLSRSLESEQLRSHELSERVTATEAELQSAKTDLERTVAHSRSLVEQLEATSSQHRSLEEKTQSLASEIASLTAALAEREKNLVGKDSEIEKLSAKLEELRKTLSERESLLVTKEKDESERIRKLKDELKRRDGEIQKLGGEITRREAEAKATADEKATLTTKLSQLSKELDSLRNEKETLELRLSGILKESEGSTERLKTAEQKITALQTAHKESEAHAHALADDLEKTRADVVRQLEHERSKAAEREQVVSAAKAALEADLTKAKDNLKASEKNHEETRQSLKAAEAQNTRLAGQLDTERASATELIERHRAESAQKEKELHEAKARVSDELKKTSEQITGLKSDIEKSRKELEKQKQLSTQAHEETSKLVRLVEEKDKRIADLQKTLESTREDFMRKVAQGTDAKERFSSLSARLATQEKELAALRHSHSELQSSSENLKASAETASKRAKELEAETVSNRQEIEKLTAERDSIVGSMETRTQETVQAALASKHDELQTLEAQRKQEAETLKSHVRDAMNELARVREELNEQLTQQREQAETLREKLALMEAEDERLKATGAKAGAAVSEATAQGPTAPEKTTRQVETPQPKPKAPAKPRKPLPQVQWSHSFESFQVSSPNTFSVTMAEKIARNPGELYNPLCLYGPENCGKTHILHAVGDLSTSEDPELTSELISLGPLLDLIQASPETATEWVDSLRLLLIDDFEISSVSPDDQKRLYLFLQALLQKDTQVVIASRVPPIKMNYLQEYLLRFLESGLLARLEAHPEVLKEHKEAAEAIAHAVRAPVEAAKPDEKPPAAEMEPKSQEDTKDGEEQLVIDEKDSLDMFLDPDPSLTAANFRGGQVLAEMEEAFANPNKKWRNSFPLLIIENDNQRRNHLFHALAHRLKKIFTEPVCLLSIDKLSEMLGLAPSFDWNGLLNKLAKARVVLINDCENVAKLPSSALGYLHAIVEEISGRDILLLVGMSKEYKKERIFGTIFKKATRKKI